MTRALSREKPHGNGAFARRGELRGLTFDFAEQIGKSFFKFSLAEFAQHPRKFLDPYWIIDYPIPNRKSALFGDIRYGGIPS